MTAPVVSAASTPRDLRDALVHAGVVASAWALGDLCVTVLLSLTVLQSWDLLDLGTVVAIVRRACLVGIATAVAARRPRRSRARAALECALLALLCSYVGVALAVGSALSEEVTGVAHVGAGTMEIDQAFERFAAFAVSPWTYVRIAGLAMGLYLAAGRRGRWSEGLALRAPVALASFDSALRLFAIPIVAIALPLFTRVADRLFARREG